MYSYSSLLAAIIFALLFSFLMNDSGISGLTLFAAFLIAFLLAYVLLRIFFSFFLKVKQLDSKIRKGKLTPKLNFFRWLIILIILFILLFGFYMLFIIIFVAI